MRNRKNLLYSTFIGLPVEISNASQRSLIGMKGTVVDETKNLIVIERDIAAGAAAGREVRVPKSGAAFRFTLESGETVDVEGKKIAFRPHERPKKV